MGVFLSVLLSRARYLYIGLVAEVARSSINFFLKPRGPDTSRALMPGSTPASNICKQKILYYWQWPASSAFYGCVKLRSVQWCHHKIFYLQINLSTFFLNSDLIFFKVRKFIDYSSITTEPNKKRLIRIWFRFGK